MPNISLLETGEYYTRDGAAKMSGAAKPDANLSQEGQGLFMCLERQGRHFAVLVPCLRPSRFRRVVRRRNSTPEYDSVERWETACESDSEIWKRLVNTCYQQQGSWKRWIPGYGIFEVREVTFQFLTIADHNQRYPIHMEPVHIQTVTAQCQDAIEMQSKSTSIDINDVCIDDNIHSSQCQISMEEWSQPCLRLEAERANDRLQLLNLRYCLTNCALYPEEANGLFSFQGFEQDGPIYSLKGRDAVILPAPQGRRYQTAQFRGLSFALGWRTDQLVRHGFFHISCVWFGVAIVWLCILFSRVGGAAWDVGLGFAQVTAASISILMSLLARQ